MRDIFMCTESLKQRPSWEIGSSSVSQRIPTILRNQESHYFAHKSPKLASVLSHMNPVNAFLSCFFKILQK
jgi:hypothetical protein